MNRGSGALTAPTRPHSRCATNPHPQQSTQLVSATGAARQGELGGEESCAHCFGSGSRSRGHPGCTRGEPCTHPRTPGEMPSRPRHPHPRASTRSRTPSPSPRRAPARRRRRRGRTPPLEQSPASSTLLTALPLSHECPVEQTDCWDIVGTMLFAPWS